ncbi:unnamed protein product, partial [Amoebophrya sp. A25]
TETTTTETETTTSTTSSETETETTTETDTTTETATGTITTGTTSTTVSHTPYPVLMSADYSTTFVDGRSYQIKCPKDADILWGKMVSESVAGDAHSKNERVITLSCQETASDSSSEFPFDYVTARRTDISGEDFFTLEYTYLEDTGVLTTFAAGRYWQAANPASDEGDTVAYSDPKKFVFMRGDLPDGPLESKLRKAYIPQPTAQSSDVD